MKYLKFETYSDFAIYEDDNRKNPAIVPSWLYYMNKVKGYNDNNGTRHYTEAYLGNDDCYYACIRKEDLSLLEDKENFPSQIYVSIEDSYERYTENMEEI